MSATMLKRRRARRPRIVGLSNHFVVAPAGAPEPFLRRCLVRLPDGRQVERNVPESTLLRLGLVVAA
jgi:hypothetical protein